MIVRIGNTMVSCGVKLVGVHVAWYVESRDHHVIASRLYIQELSTPKAETPAEGYFGNTQCTNTVCVCACYCLVM